MLSALVLASSLTAPLFPLKAVRLLDGPFRQAAIANRTYVLAHDPDRLLAPFRREAGLTPKKPSYENWENSGLDGHTAGHYLSALANMIAAGDDTKDREVEKRLAYMVDELEACQKAAGDGYLGGVPGSRELWKAVAAGDVDAVNGKWVPWYNLHKTYAGLRDAYLVGGNKKARTVLVRYGDWAVDLVTGLSDAKMQRMLRQEHGGMNESLADIYAITGDRKYLEAAERFNHQAVLEPLEKSEDRLTGLHANTQIPKVIGLARQSELSNDAKAMQGARFFWETVTGKRSVAFGGNSVSEHFNDPKNFRGLLEHREGPETCNTYNMLRLTEQLFSAKPQAAYADYYERALYNHILASINPAHPGYVYFTPIRPGHYRVYSEPGQGFWCCVGTGMENPGRYGQFIYANALDGLYVNLFLASEVSSPEAGLTLRQETAFPDEERTRLTLKLKKSKTFTLHLRHPAWVEKGRFTVRVNGQAVPVTSTPSSYVPVRREWKNGDRVEIDLPMQTRVEGLPDGSPWYAILRGPIVLASPTGKENQVGLHAGPGRGDHIAHGPLVPLDKMPALVTTPEELLKHVVPDPAGGPLGFRLKDVANPAPAEGLALVPFFRLHESRYQMYWEVATQEEFARRQERLAAEERAKIARDLATLDAVAVGEQQPESDHGLVGESMESGMFDGRRWRHGRWFQYTLNSKGAKAVELAVTYHGGDAGRTFDILVNGTRIATESLKGDQPGQFPERRYTIPADLLAAAPNDRLTIKFSAENGLAGGIYDVRLMRKD
jgi:DUF1680 family protein